MADNQPVVDPTDPPQFDPAAFKTELTSELTKIINATVNSSFKNLSNEFGKKFQPIKDDPPPVDPPVVDPPVVDPKVKTDPAVNAELQNMRKKMDLLEKKSKDSEDREKAAVAKQLESERVTNVRSILNEINFKTPALRETFFKANVADIKRDDNGDLIAEGPSGPLPAKDYLIGQADLLPEWLAPQGKSGAGATQGTRGPGNRKWSMADLTPANINALKPEEQAELFQLAASGQIT